MEITAGIQTIIQIIAYAIVGTVFIVMIKSDVKVIKVQMEGIISNIKILNNSFDKLGAVLTQVAVQDQRLSGLEEDIRELKHGEGFVRGPRGIDREYGSKE